MEIIYFLIIIAICIGIGKIAHTLNIKKDSKEAVIAGVCAGIAKKFNVSPKWVRLGFVISVIAYGIGILPYMVLVIMLDD